MNWLDKLSIAFIGILFSAGCSFQVDKGSSDSPVGAMALDSFQALEASVFQPRCAICHANGTAEGGVDLSTYSSILGNPGLITPGSPENSRIYNEVSSGDMPKNDAPLSAAEVGALRQWILAGAPDGGFNTGADDPSRHVNLSSYALMLANSNPKVLQTGSADQSLVYNEVVDGSMPPKGAAIDPALVELLKNWIDQGAKND